MSRLLAEIEALAAAPFVFLIAAIAGTIQAIPAFLHLESLNIATAHTAEVGLATGIGVLESIGAALLWWFAVRRHQHSIWLTALHVTLGLAVADLLMNGLAFVAASIQTHGEFASAYAGALPGALWGPVSIALLRSPFWFVQALALIALGRLVLRMDVRIAPSPATNRDAA